MRVADKRLKVVCGANTGYLEHDAWVTEKLAYDICQLRVSPNSSVKPNLGGMELAEALSRVIPFASKEDDRPVLACVRFAQKDGKLTLTSADGYRLAEVSLDFEDGEGEALIPAKELAGLTSALKKAKRVRLDFEDSGERLDSKRLVIDTELIRYKWVSTVGTYPDTAKLFPTEFIAEARFDTRDMLRASASLGALFLDKDTPIIITIKDGMIRLSVKDDKGEDQIEAQAEGEAQTAINGVKMMLLAIVPVTPTDASRIILDHCFGLRQVDNFMPKETLKKVALLFSVVHEALHVVCRLTRCGSILRGVTRVQSAK